MRLALLCALIVSCLQELAMVQSVFRHGARYPIYPNKYDQTMYAVELDKTGELTSVGKRMHYLLGKKMYQQYWAQLGLGTKLNQTFIYVKSTDVNRTIQSVQSQLFGLFETLQPWTLSAREANLSVPSWEPATDFNSMQGDVYTGIPAYHSAPIHVEKEGASRLDEGDFLRMYSPNNCPNQDQWQQQNQKTDFAKGVLGIPRVAEAIQEITSFYNFTEPMTLFNVSNYVDNYLCSKYLGRPYAPIYEGEYYKEYYFINTMSLYINLFFTDLQINATVTGFLNSTRQNMINVMKSTVEEKLIIYSAHDTTVANVLAGLRLVNSQCILDQYTGKNESKLSHCEYDYPYYASNLIFELHQSANRTYFVKVRYNGQYVPLVVCGGKTECPWEQFDTFLIQTIRRNYLSDCGIPDFATQNRSLRIGLIVGASVMGVLLVVLAAHILYRGKKDLDQKMKQSLIVVNE